MVPSLYQGRQEGASGPLRWQRLTAFLLLFTAGTALHLAEHLWRGLDPFVAWTALPAIPVGLLALWGVWRRRPWGARLTLLLAAGALVFGGLEHLVLPGPDRLARAPLPSAVLTGLLLALAPVLGFVAWRALRAGPARRGHP